MALGYGNRCLPKCSHTYRSLEVPLSLLFYYRCYLGSVHGFPLGVENIKELSVYLGLTVVEGVSLACT
jgi:hypothetical protein